MDKIKFIKMNEWAILPEKNILENREIYHGDDLRWIKNNRIKGACWPYKMAHDLGWIIKSPIDIQLEPVEEVQVQCEDYELQELGAQLNIDFWVRREKTFLGIKPDGWFRVHQAKVNGNWQSLLIPNGEYTFEWRLGWGIKIPKDFVVMILPVDGNDGFVVHPGILTEKSLDKFNEGLGFSLAFEPKKKTFIKRGTPLAKIIIFHNSALHLKSEKIEGVSNLEMV
ncbi:TPA: hypothetical protein ACGXP3_005003 [Bacillus cereus]|uniref:hypothetical protein n=1 Tax=Bacillus sp. TH13 TaxID=2796379 RepID=UPI001914CD2A|nr:hypothetical protein [Bacillus sp. TH13]MBK5492746.1 hypothetical protein [Bacillus sp. TH13]